MVLGSAGFSSKPTIRHSVSICITPNWQAASAVGTRSAATVTSALLSRWKSTSVAVVHLVDVVAGQDHHVLGPLLLERVDVLIDGVGRALVPVLVDALLRRHDVDELAQLAAQVTAASRG